MPEVPSPKRGVRFSPKAILRMRAAIEEAEGDEVFAIGDVDPLGRVSHLEVHCRGTQDAVTALLRRPRAGQVVVHNHPSGDIRPSEADLQLAGRYGDEGVGVVIVNNELTRDRWVVEPARRRLAPVPRDRLRAFFLDDLPRVMGRDFEARPQQLEMAEAMADALDEGGPLVVEAGTGTGKSLAYLVPAVLWALENDAKVAVSTYTRALQGQLLGSDLPLIRSGGLEFRAALLKGRGNYLCRRKLELALKEPGLDAEALLQLEAWTQATEEGSIQDFGERVDRAVWERVESDADHTLRARCPHYNQCFYYNARRRAAASHLLILNHALLLSDLYIKSQTDGDGILPRFDRVILDEGHHLEDAATSVISQVLSARSLRLATGPLLARRRRPGALQRIRERFADKEEGLAEQTVVLEEEVARLRDEVEPALDHVADEVLEPGAPQARVTRELEVEPRWLDSAAPSLAELGRRIQEVGSRVAALNERVGQLKIPAEQMQPVLDLRRAERRLGDQAALVRALLDPDGAWCRYVERSPRRRAVRLCRAPVDVGPVLRGVLFDPMETVGITSATLTVAGRFEHLLGRLGLDEARTLQLDSPFVYREQAVLALPRDLPNPNAPDFSERAGAVLISLLEASGGGAFVLCTSYAQVEEFGRQVQAALGQRMPVLVQGQADRTRLLRRFRESEVSVLIGTDSFWEGVSVRGRALRQVIIPRLPFRVPTEPVAQARYELLRLQGRDPFRAYALPEAVLKLRQGFGRLVRARSDRGAVVILDRRMHEMWYGRVFTASLPDARRLTGPTRVVVDQLERFYRELPAVR
ncbi:MAG: helicase [Alphaproteobacteria bacterium]|nr:helicase [Alphaproteobacteria bacterium]